MVLDGSIALFLVIIMLGVFALGLISIIGQVYLTKFSFTSTSQGDTRTIVMKDWELQFSRVTVVLNWVIVGLSVIGGVLQTVRMASRM